MSLQASKARFVSPYCFPTDFRNTVTATGLLLKRHFVFMINKRLSGLNNFCSAYCKYKIMLYFCSPQKTGVAE